jgi:hypothetical protein
LRILWFIVLGLLALAAWDVLQNDGRWGQNAGRSIQQTIDGVLSRFGLE